MSSIFYYDGSWTSLHPDIVEGGPGWYFMDEWNQIHGFNTEKEAKEAYAEMEKDSPFLEKD